MRFTTGRIGKVPSSVIKRFCGCSVIMTGTLPGALMYHASRYDNANLHRFTPQAVLEAEYQRMLEKEKTDG